MSITTLRKMIEGTNGKFFNVTFKKADGSSRAMNCRTNVTKHLKGGTSTTAHKDNLVTVFDAQKKQYRCINLETVTEITIEGTKFEVGK